MSAPGEVDLTVAPPWRSIPMPGSEQQLDVVRLASPRDRLTLHCRFPVGFERTVPGGYAVSEEFLVLEGELEIGERTCVPGDLVVVPARYLRPGMRAPRGCRVLAWFGGPADFVEAGGLQACHEPLVSVPTAAAARGHLAASDAGTWSRGAVPEGDGVVEVVSGDLASWRRGDVTPGPDDLVRRER